MADLNEEIEKYNLALKRQEEGPETWQQMLGKRYPIAAAAHAGLGFLEAPSKIESQIHNLGKWLSKETPKTERDEYINQLAQQYNIPSTAAEKYKEEFEKPGKKYEGIQGIKKFSGNVIQSLPKLYYEPGQTTESLTRGLGENFKDLITPRNKIEKGAYKVLEEVTPLNLIFGMGWKQALGSQIAGQFTRGLADKTNLSEPWKDVFEMAGQVMGVGMVGKPLTTLTNLAGRAVAKTAVQAAKQPDIVLDKILSPNVLSNIEENLGGITNTTVQEQIKDFLTNIRAKAANNNGFIKVRDLYKEDKYLNKLVSEKKLPLEMKPIHDAIKNALTTQTEPSFGDAYTRSQSFYHAVKAGENVRSTISKIFGGLAGSGQILEALKNIILKQPIQGSMVRAAGQVLAAYKGGGYVGQLLTSIATSPEYRKELGKFLLNAAKENIPAATLNAKTMKDIYEQKRKEFKSNQPIEISAKDIFNKPSTNTKGKQFEIKEISAKDIFNAK